MPRRSGRNYRSPFGLKRYSPAALLFIIVAVVISRWLQEQRHPAPPAALAEQVYRVRRVVDGDTLVLDNNARIRLIGADTPETVHPNRPVEPWGPEATQFTKQFVAGGSVRLQFDREPKDKYDRFLAYVFVGDRMLNEELIRAGLAHAETQYRYSSSMKTRFRRAEDEARSAGRGIWSGEGVHR